jgi:co-chaperonin GroES (HSP10)
MEATKFRAYGNRIIVDFSRDVPGMTKGGIKLPENTRIDPIGTATVVSVGPGVMTAHGWDAPSLAVGDVVTFERTRCQVLDRDNFIGVMWAGEVLGVKRDSDFPRREAA